MKWQKSARLVMVLVGVATIAGVAVTMRKRQPPVAAGVVRQDRKAVAEVAGGRMTQATGIRIPGFIDSERYFTYEDGSTRFVKLKLTTSRAGRDFVLEAREGNLGPDQAHMTVTGDVVLTASDGLHATTDEATYSSGEQVVRVPRKIEFSRGLMKGSGVGMTYDQRREVLWLLDQAQITVAPEKGKDPGLKLVSGAAGLARRDKYMRFERGFNATRGGLVMSADASLAYLSDDEKRVESLELRGNSRIVMRGAAEGGLQSMSGRDANLAYADDGETLERVSLAGSGVIQLAGAGGQPGRRIAGEVVDVTLGPDGQVTELVARDQVQLTLPAAADAPERTIRAATMDGTGEPGKGLTGARFAEKVEFREQRPGGAARTARSKTLTVVLGAGGGVDDARFAGGTRFEDGALVALAQDARYLVSSGQLLLSGHIGPQPPEVRDERLLVKATTIDLTFDGPKMIAKGNVQSVSVPAKKDAAGKSPSHVPGMLKEDQPTNVAAAALDYDGTADKAVYTGGARLWQKETAIAAETITIDEASGDLLASGQVRTTLPFEQLDTKTNEKKKVTTVATARDMHYEDAARRATYTTDAHVNGPQGDLRGVKIEMYLAEGGGSLERVEAYDDVTLKADDRIGTGRRMTYFAADERYLMTGSPVKIVEQQECRETTGKVVTFYRSNDRVQVDGIEERRTQTLGGGPCPQAAPK